MQLNAKATGAVSYKVISGASCASVNSKGKVTLKKAGTVKIQITAKKTSKYEQATRTVVIKIK